LKFGGEFLKIHRKYLLLDITLNAEMRVMERESRSTIWSEFGSEKFLDSIVETVIISVNA
jgi:hypothetical protein